MWPFTQETKKREYVRVCNVFCCREKDRAIVASVFNHGGLFAEKPGGTTTCALSNTQELGGLVKNALSACEYEENFNYSESKRNDWPAFQASGYRTVKSFEADFVRFLVRGVNESNLFFEVQGPEIGDHSLRISITINAFADEGEFGLALAYVLEKFHKFREMK